MTKIALINFKGVVPIPPQLWLSEDKYTKGVAETSALYDAKHTKEHPLNAELGFLDYDAEYTIRQGKVSQNQGICFGSSLSLMWEKFIYIPVSQA